MGQYPVPDLDGLARAFLVAGQHRADHAHGRAEADALGDVAMFADAAIGDDGLGGHPGAPLQRAQLPAAGPEARLHLGDADLAWTHAHLGGVRAPVLQIDHGLRRGDVAGDDEGLGQAPLDVLDGLAHAVCVAVRDVDGDVVGAHALGCQAVDGVEVCRLHPRADGDEQAQVAHALRIGHVVEVEAMHHVEVAVGRQPLADRFIDHRLHVGRHDRQCEPTPAEFHRGVAFAAAFHAAFARQQQDVVVVEDFHCSSSIKTVESA